MLEKFGTVRLNITAAIIVIDIGRIRVLSLISFLIYFANENLFVTILSIF